MTDEEFCDRNDDHRTYVRDMVKVASESLGEEFENDERTTMLVITDWGKWQSNTQPGESPGRHRREMIEDMGWPSDDRGGDVIIGFSGQKMSADTRGSFVSKCADGVARTITNSIMIGTNELTVSDYTDLEYHLLLHEIGHLYGAKHPRDSEIPDGTGGVMCKYTCVTDQTVDGFPIITIGEKWMFTTYEFSSANHKLMNIPDVALADYHRRTVNQNGRSN